MDKEELDNILKQIQQEVQTLSWNELAGIRRTYETMYHISGDSLEQRVSSLEKRVSTLEAKCVGVPAIKIEKLVQMVHELKKQKETYEELLKSL